MSTPEEHWWSVRAGEYVLGTLSGADFDLFEKILQHDSQLQKEVAYWERRLAGLNETTDAVIPDARVWNRILDAIQNQDEQRANYDHHARHNEFNDPAQSEQLAPSLGWQNELTPAHRVRPDSSALWKSLSGFSFAACLLMGYLLFQSPVHLKGNAFEPDGVAIVLSDDEDLPYFLIETDYRNSRLRVTVLTPPELGTTDVFQLWQAMPDRSSVKAVTRLPEKKGYSEIVEIDSLIDGSELFGVSIERIADSTQDGPLGPVVAHGDFVQTWHTD